jgi:hypothetical protein
MVALPAPAQSRPEARVFRIEELLVHARAGRIRVPSFQRGFKWERSDVRKLLDSIWRGYPIGTLLLWSKVGAAGQVMLGDLTFEVSEQSSAWFVVDGQQRIVSLVSTLLARGARGEKFDFYFDLVNSEVVPSRRGGQPATHLPLDRVVDSEELLAWVDDGRAALTPEQIRLAFRVGKTLREYELPAYVVNIDDERVVREIFERTNATGKSLDVSDVFNALHTPSGRQPAVSLKEVVERLRVRSLGDINEDQVLRNLLAIENKDLAGELQRQLVDVDVPAAVERVERAMDRVFGFLAQDAGIPHLRLLPYQSPLTVLSAFLRSFPDPIGSRPEAVDPLAVAWHGDWRVAWRRQGHASRAGGGALRRRGRGDRTPHPRDRGDAAPRLEDRGTLQSPVCALPALGDRARRASPPRPADGRAHRPFSAAQF